MPASSSSPSRPATARSRPLRLDPRAPRIAPEDAEEALRPFLAWGECRICGGMGTLVSLAVTEAGDGYTLDVVTCPKCRGVGVAGKEGNNG